MSRVPDLVRRVRAFVDRESLWDRETRLVAAVSGGSDSVALAHLLAQFTHAGVGRLVGLVHVHHGLRGEAADADAAFVEALSTRLGVPLLVRRVDVQARARAEGWSLEVAGREARLACYAEALHTYEAERVAVGHTRGDQAETVLLRLARGTGPRGLAAMAPVNGWRVRPLLETDREDLRAWLRAQGEPWCEDATNADLRVPRNRVRAEVLPSLRAVNPRADEALARMARLQAADTALLETLADEAWTRLVVTRADEVQVDSQGLTALPEALATRVARRALQAAGLTGDARQTAVLRSGAATRRFGRVSVQRLGTDVVLRNTPLRLPAEPRQTELGALVLPVPGVVTLESAGLSVSAEGPSPVVERPPHAPDQVCVCADVATGGLVVRGWRAGDRIQPFGMRGHRKLQDVFVDRKVPRDERSMVPVVCAHDGMVIWVAGHVLSERARVTTRSSGMVVLKIWRRVSARRPL
jgi:tRNA(Ile)-lysidine synthase